MSGLHFPAQQNGDEFVSISAVTGPRPGKEPDEIAHSRDRSNSNKTYSCAATGRLHPDRLRGFEMGAFENLGRSFARRASENVDQRRPRRAKVAVILVFMRVALLVVAWAGFLLYLLYQVIEWTFS